MLKLVAAGVLPGSTGLVQLACTQDGYRPEFFSASELDFLDALTEVVLPADDHSPGASAARVARYIDVMIADGTSNVKQSWRAGLEAVSEMANQRFHQDFVECDAAQQDEIIGELARSEESPSTEAELFFADLKRMTIDGYYTSQIGIHDDLGYMGNTAVDDFPGCTHESHASDSKQQNS